MRLYIWVIVPSEHSKNRDEEEEVEARLNWFPELKFYSRRSLLSIERFMHMFFRGGLGTRVIYSCCCWLLEGRAEREINGCINILCDMGGR